ncbi:MAG: thioesterase family protein [Marinibacterium sp.]
MPDPAPFVSTLMTVSPEWIDYNGHLNMAYYNVLFDRCADQVFGQLGVGEDYAARGFTTYTAEFHLCYVRELHVHDRVRVSWRLMDHDASKLHSFQELYHEDGWLAATGEALTLHIDRSGPKVAPFPPDIAGRISDMAAEHAGLPRPDRAGRSVGIRRRPAG